MWNALLPGEHMPTYRGFTVSTWYQEGKKRNNCISNSWYFKLQYRKKLKRLKKTTKQWMGSHSLMSTTNISSKSHAWLLSLCVVVWLHHEGNGVSRHLEFSAVSEAFSVQSINHLSSATVETFILDPRYGLPEGPPFQCSAVMLFNCKHNNSYYYFRQKNRHLQVSTATSCHLPVAGGNVVAMLWW